MPEIISKLKPLTIFNTADDPDSSEICSFPFLEVFDIIVHAGVMFNNETTISEEFKKRGAKKTYFMPTMMEKNLNIL